VTEDAAVVPIERHVEMRADLGTAWRTASGAGRGALEEA
jgi:hypothetical protein